MMMDSKLPDLIERDIDVVIVGLAREGTALARFLAGRGARVTITDAKPAEALGDSITALAGLPVLLALGGHPLSLLDAASIIFVSPGVPLEIPFLVEARQRGLPLSSETRLFTRLCPAEVIGITGSSGKTTTTALVGDMLQAAGCHTWVGGNIGRPLIDHLAEITPTDRVVMELSSFQLEFFGSWPGADQGETGPEKERGVIFDPRGWSPSIAAILNITPNHLDRHPTMEAYIAAKAHILAAADRAILNLDDPITRQMGEQCNPRQVAWFSLEHRVEQGSFLRGSDLVVVGQDGHEEVVCRTDQVRLLGRHNLANLLAACCLAQAASVPVEAMRRVATTFSGVEHRLELVRERGSVRWYNDSIATSPERTVAALQAFDAPILLLAGGRDKHLPWANMAALARRKVRHVILFGEAAALIEQAMITASKADRGRSTCQIHQAGTLEHAVELAAKLARAGEVVLLSPGGTSFDAYRDFVARGEHFRQLVKALR
jgi:UDP-N-acetylmuramoylalanine--D-glutamate ligase